MFCVLIGGELHSAWDTRAEAEKQRTVVEDAGYLRVRVQWYPLECENGQYFETQDF